MAKGVFITGTDTGVGKTCFTLALMQTLKKQDRHIAGMKPVASGAKRINGLLMNEDARLIKEHCSHSVAYELINPVVYELPVAPVFAAGNDKETTDFDEVFASYNRLASEFDNIIVEGVGGWRAPLSDRLGTVDLVRELALPVILVVGLRLGCLNHALLTAEVIRADGVDLCGWVSNMPEKDYLFKDETIALLNDNLACPHVADLDYVDGIDRDKMAKKIDHSFIMGPVFR
jgi:dethiobiotin synthetase